MDIGAVVPATDVYKRAVADDKRATGIIRHRGPDDPAAAALFVDITRHAGSRVSPRGNDARVINRSSVKPQPGDVHVPANAPTVRDRIVDLRDRGCHRVGSSAAEQIQSPVQYRAAGPCDGYWHWAARSPSVAGDVVDVQRVHLPTAIVAAGNV